ncbi:MAG TPA: protocatechuate 3,4-dioxygenase [Allosphingosinicella sp.]|nr:protocatechuate 3,4-dioxygenase [Allosphingosinicella sp.]
MTMYRTRGQSGPIAGRGAGDNMLSRRRFTQGGLASAGLLLSGPALALQAREPTAESPLGPFYPVNRLAENDIDLTRLAGRSERALGDVIEISGRVLDMRGNPIEGAVLELWQANAAGRYMHESDIATAPLDPNFQGYATLRTDAAGDWRIVTIKPGGYDSPIGQRTPHIHFMMQGRSHRNVAQMYFAEEGPANALDRLYRDLGEAARTSIATRDPADRAKYRWDIVMMG